jgi:hypothetical protein
MLKKIITLFIITFCCVNAKVFSQGTCEQTLNQATAEFEAGRFYGLPSLLKNCLESGFTKEQQFRAYYILTQAYLVLDDPLGAENSYLKLLTVDPEFKPNSKNDPIDLYYLSKRFTTRPRFTPHYRLGANISFPNSIHTISTSPKEVSVSKTIRVGFQAGMGLDWNIDDRWSLCTGIGYSTKSFTVSTTGIAQTDNGTTIDKSIWLDIPLYIKYSVDSGRIRPFGYVGFAANLLVESSASSVFNDNSQGSTRIAQGPDVDLTYKRNFFNRSFVFGGGIKYKMGKNFIYADARYMMGLTNITIPDKNYYNSDGTLATTLTQYQYASDFFSLDNLSLSIGYIRPLYDPRKIKKFSSKGIFRKLGKSKQK